jgi:hypothetical protein
MEPVRWIAWCFAPGLQIDSNTYCSATQVTYLSGLTTVIGGYLFFLYVSRKTHAL